MGIILKYHVQIVHYVSRLGFEYHLDIYITLYGSLKESFPKHRPLGEILGPKDLWYMKQPPLC